MTIDAADYEAACQRMNEAAGTYVRTHPFAGPYVFNTKEFELSFARKAGRPNERVAVIAVLSDVIDQWAGNEDARALLRAMVAAEPDATYLMAKVLVERQQEEALKRSTGKMTAPGDWQCPSCHKALDGFTDPSGRGHVPTPGAITVCGYCADVLVMGDAAFAPLSDSVLRELPKSLRMQILTSRNAVQAMLRARRARS